MPARSNAFQRLVRAIQGHLSRTGTVKESRMLPDKDTGSLVEVDIVIDESIGGHPILVGIECTAEKRKATIEWYREMRGKHSGLPIDKTVLVSQSGFTREVHKKARKDNVTLMTPGQAQAFGWQTLFAKLKGGTVADVQFSLRRVSLVSNDTEAMDPGSFTADSVLRIPGKELPLGRLIMEVAQQHGLTRKIMASLSEVLKKTDHFSFRFNVPKYTSIVIGDKTVSILSVEATLSIHPRYQHVDWKPVEVNGQTVAAGTFPAEFLFPGAPGDSVVTASRGPNDDFKVTLLGPQDNDIQLDTFPDALWQNPTEPRD